MRRYTPLAPSTGTRWPPEVRAHVRLHQHGCIGPLAGMPGRCDGALELDHIRASGAVGMKSKSIATNAAQLCGWHHHLKTTRGRTWRPDLVTINGALARDCESCREEAVREWGTAPEDPHAAHVDPCSPTCRVGAA